MKVVWTNQFAQLPSQGGGTRHFELAMALKNFGISTTIIAGNRNYLSGTKVFNKSGCYTVDGVNFCVVDIIYKPGYIRRAYSWLEYAYKLKHFKDKFHNADVIIGSTPTLFGAYSTMKMAQKFAKPFILEVRDLWPEILYYSGKLSKHSLPYITMEKIAHSLYKNSAYIITLSEGQKNYIRAFTHTPISVVYNGVSDDIINKLQKKEKYAGFNLVYAGALGYANDIDTIIEAARLLKSYKDIKFHILGDGIYRRKIEKEIEKGNANFIYHGTQPKEKAFSIMQSCQVGLLTLKNIELFKFGVSPNKLFDYLSLGLFVISTVKGEMGKIVLNSGCGVITEPSNPAELKNTILKHYHQYIKEPHKFNCTTGIEYVKKHFSRKKMAEKIDKILRTVYEQN